MGKIRGKGRRPVAYAAGNTIRIPETKIPVVKEVDVVVIGAGPAGFGAATTAARLGADTVLIERFGAVGGVMTNALQGHFFSVPGPGGGLYTELYERCLQEGVISECSERIPRPTWQSSLSLSQIPCRRDGW